MKHILFTLSLLALGFALLAGGSRQAHAFCGFYVSGADAELVNETTEVVLMRDGLETVLSMRNNYKGPPEDFAMVVPVPQVLKKEDVNTLDGAVFDRLSNYTKPRLVEYWERPGCAPKSGIRGPTQTAGGGVSGSIPRPGGPPGAKIEAQFEVGEYEILILSASESNGLEQWLLDNNYNIPKGASEVLASYIARGMYFFVAKVNASKVMFDSKGNALLSPLRFHYTSAEFSLPVRLGLLNAKGPQDLLIHTISRDGRHEVANRENVTIPTNLVVPEKTKDNFSRKYEEIFRRTLRKRWSPSSRGITGSSATLAPRTTPRSRTSERWEAMSSTRSCTPNPWARYKLWIRSHHRGSNHRPFTNSTEPSQTMRRR